MTDIKDMMAKKVQAAARGYIARKTGYGKKKPGKAGKPVKAGKPGNGGKPGKKKPKDDDMQAKVIQMAFKQYQAYAKKH